MPAGVPGGLSYCTAVRIDPDHTFPSPGVVGKSTPLRRLWRRLQFLHDGSWRHDRRCRTGGDIVAIVIAKINLRYQARRLPCIHSSTVVQGRVVPHRLSLDNIDGDGAWRRESLGIDRRLRALHGVRQGLCGKSSGTAVVVGIRSTVTGPTGSGRYGAGFCQDRS